MTDDVLDDTSEDQGKWLKTLDRALAIQQRVVERNVDRVRRSRPEAIPAELIGALEKAYTATVTATGAGAGAAAAAPGVGTPVALALGAGEAGVFLEATALFALSVASVHGVRVDDVERRRTLVLAVVLGDAGFMTVQRMAGRTGAHWGKKLTQKIPIEAIRAANRVLGRNFITRYGTRQGIIVLGRLAPFGIGAAIGAGANAAIGWGVVRTTRRVFGPPPPLPVEAGDAPVRPDGVRDHDA
ncbi:hypothetical protein [Actinotalea solisilvae]|uniref:hypothetical protein n=1 Tax=Actinotalea solisilvae TaxID=2072922 RepID=UPI0018F1A85C|nr:hypothetical protein [Actinotalea solisilvae]